MRQNNFDFLRLICALLVVVSHSWDLSGHSATEPLLLLTGRRLVCSAIGLCGFFTISGYLIYNSLVNSKSVGIYIEKRFLRIFPGLAVCLLVTIFACYWVYDGVDNYWTKSGTWNYLWCNLTLYDLHDAIPGIFENNPYPASVNGSIWTLCYEFTMYLLIIPLFFIHRRKSSIVLPSVALILILIKNIIFPNKFMHASFMHYMNLNQFCRFAQFFIVGMGLAIMERYRILDKYWNRCRWYFAVNIILPLVCFGLGQTALGMFFLSILFIQIGKMNWSTVTQFIKKIGDLSYGIYIYSFVLQQITMSIFSDTPPPIYC